MLRGKLLNSIAANSQAGTTVVTFDTLPDGTVPDGYGGINWDSNWIVYSEAQDPYNPESPRPVSTRTMLSGREPRRGYRR